MRQRAGPCAAFLMLLVAAACSSDVEEVYGSIDGVDARVAGLRNGTKLMLVGDRTGTVSEETLSGNWVRFKVAERSRARADAADQCLSIVDNDGSVLPVNKSGSSFRQDVWVRAAALREQEAELRRAAEALQAEIDQAENGRRSATQWLERNTDVYSGGRCETPADAIRPAAACAPVEQKSFALRRCKEAVIDCAVIALTMGKTGDAMFDSTFLGTQVTQACGMQTAPIVGDDYGVAPILAATMPSKEVKSAAQDLAVDPANPQLLEQFAQSVMGRPEFAECVTKAEHTCASQFDRWQSELSQRLRRCQATRRAAASARDKLAQINQRRDELERQMAPLRQELAALRTGGAVVLPAGCVSPPMMTLRPEDQPRRESR